MHDGKVITLKDIGILLRVVAHARIPDALFHHI